MEPPDRTPSEHEAAAVLAAALRQDAAAHEAGTFAAIAERYDDVLAQVLPLCETLPDGVSQGFTFWDGWADARNHEWMYYEGIGRDDWPGLARLVADAVESDVGFTDPRLLRHFGPPTKSDPFAWIARLLGLRRERS